MNIDNQKEYILCAAIWFDDGKKYDHQPKNIETGFVIAGRRHHNCFTTMYIISNKDTSYNKNPKIQGFITNLDRFVNREEASKIAYKAGQTKQLKFSLYSEDLY